MDQFDPDTCAIIISTARNDEDYHSLGLNDTILGNFDLKISRIEELGSKLNLRTYLVYLVMFLVSGTSLYLERQLKWSKNTLTLCFMINFCLQCISFYKLNYNPNGQFYDNMQKAGYLQNGISKPKDLTKHLKGDISIFGNLIVYSIFYKLYISTTYADVICKVMVFSLNSLGYYFLGKMAFKYYGRTIRAETICWLLLLNEPLR